jgi:diadenosine tetraphosphate (Ap4A) HIT family hydrolase
MTCPFCDIDRLEQTQEGLFWVAFLDKFPLSPGHTLVIPKRHCSGYAELDQNEKRELMEMIDRVRSELAAKYKPEAFNVGWNDGPEAGQTIFHFHVHVIPRYRGDVKDPRGGVRWILPDRAPYWDDEKP